MSLVNNRIYVDGRVVAEPVDLGKTREAMQQPGSMAWIGYLNPTPEEIHALAAEFKLNDLAVEDTLKGGQRAKFEHYDTMTYTVLWPAVYNERSETVEFGEIHIFTGPDFVITCRRSATPDLAKVRTKLESEASWLLGLGPQAVLYAILDEVVDEYAPVLDGVQNDIDEIEDQIFDGDANVARRIFKLTKEVFAFQRASRPISDILAEIATHFTNKGVDQRLVQRINDVKDHDRRVADRTEAFRAILQEAFVVHNTLVNQQLNLEMKNMADLSIKQNEQVKRISSWGAIFFAPSLVASIYGMNFVHMPEKDWRFGYPMSFAIMFAMAYSLYRIFKKKDWL